MAAGDLTSSISTSNEDVEVDMHGDVATIDKIQTLPQSKTYTRRILQFAGDSDTMNRWVPCILLLFLALPLDGLVTGLALLFLIPVMVSTDSTSNCENGYIRSQFFVRVTLDMCVTACCVSSARVVTSRHVSPSRS